MKKWYKVSPVKCYYCGDPSVTFSDILMDGKILLNGRMKCKLCLKWEKDILAYWTYGASWFKQHGSALLKGIYP